MDETVHFLITDKETFDRMNGREKKSERISKSETLDTMICDIQVLERLKSAKPALGSRKIDMKPILEDCKLSTWGSFKPPGKWFTVPYRRTHSVPYYCTTRPQTGMDYMSRSGKP